MTAPTPEALRAAPITDMLRIDVAGVPVMVRGEQARMHLEEINAGRAQMRLELAQLRAALAQRDAEVARLREIVRSGHAAVSASYSQALAEFHGHDISANKYDRIVKDWRKSARTALAAPGGEST